MSSVYYFTTRDFKVLAKSDSDEAMDVTLSYLGQLFAKALVPLKAIEVSAEADESLSEETGWGYYENLGLFSGIAGIFLRQIPMIMTVETIDNNASLVIYGLDLDIRSSTYLLNPSITAPEGSNKLVKATGGIISEPTGGSIWEIVKNDGVVKDKNKAEVTTNEDLFAASLPPIPVLLFKRQDNS